MEKKFRKNKGITLVALVITVIILLILSGISIASLTGNGLFEKARLAKEKQKNAQELENATLSKYENEISQYIDNTRNDKVIEDYTTNLIYKLNLNNLSNQPGVTINGTGVTVSSDKKYVSFDGSSYINVSNDTIDPNFTVRNQSDVTLCCWYRTTTILNKDNCMVTFGENTINQIHNNHYLDIKNSPSIGAGQGYATCDRFIDPSNFKDGNWHFIVGIWKDNNTVQFYYDGVPFTATGSYSTSNAYLNIGGASDGFFYTGDLSDIRVYSNALTENQVKQLYKYGKNYLGID